MNMPVKPKPSHNSSNEGAVLAKATIRAADKLDVSQKVLASIIGVSESVVSRMRNGSFALDRNSGKSFELAALFIRLYRSLDAIVGGDETVAKAWLKNENTALQCRPIDLIQKVQGLLDVIRYLDARRAPI
jgi:predicted transcriptional regulator